MTVLVKSEAVCRPIEENILAGVVDCLVRHFPDRSRAYWATGVARLGRLPTIADRSRYGYALVKGAEVVGVLLTIHSERRDNGGLLCNLSSWCVDEPYRGSALALHFAATRNKDTTYLNLSPAASTQAAITALGFKPFSRGQAIVAPALCRPRLGLRVHTFEENSPLAASLPDRERRMICDHASYGCVAALCAEGGRIRPFVFQPYRLWRQRLPGYHLIYARSLSDFVRCAGALGRRFLRQSALFVSFDAVEATKNAPGFFALGRFPRYYKGGPPPSLTDLAYSELTLFGP